MNDPATMPAVHTQTDVGYLPLPNRVDLVLTDVPPPIELTPTSFVIGITDDGGVVLADHGERGLEITGGHIDPGENPSMAARREGAEESGAEYGMLWPIGFLRCVSGGSVPEDHPYPHPVGYQAIHAGGVISLSPRDDYLECRPPVVMRPDQFATLRPSLAGKMPLLYAAALAALGRNRSIDDLARDALPLNDDDWSSSRQIDAENRFFDECRRLRPDTFSDEGDFSVWALKATSEERIEEALRLLRA